MENRKDFKHGRKPIVREGGAVREVAEGLGWF